MHGGVCCTEGMLHRKMLHEGMVHENGAWGKILLPQ